MFEEGIYRIEKVPLATLEDCDKIVARSSFQNREILGFNGSRCDLLKHTSPRSLRGKQARPIRDEKRRICGITGVREIYDRIEQTKRNERKGNETCGVIDDDTIFVKFTFHGVENIRNIQRIEIRRCFVYALLRILLPAQDVFMITLNDRIISLISVSIIFPFRGTEQSRDIFCD